MIFPVFNFEGDSWNDPLEYNFSHFEDAQKYTQEENSSIAVNFELPYNDGDDSFKFGAKYKAKEKMKPALSAEEMEKIYRLADQMDQMQQVDQRESAWSEQDLIDLFGKKTIH